jgi:cupin 2 domain-containing protein
MTVKNFFSDVPKQLPDEWVENVIEGRNFRVERIVSHGHASPKDFWYDQEQNEWVILLQGRAALQFEGVDGFVQLGPGDYLKIPAHKRHRVEWTDPDRVSIWLAVHY